MKFQSEQLNENRRSPSTLAGAETLVSKREHRSQRGVALVMTLIMLSVITFLTIAFLALSRRDRASVSTSQSQTDSHLMADTALARAQSEMTAKMMARNSLQFYEPMLTRNFINLNGFDASGLNRTNLENVNYDYYVTTLASPLGNNDKIQNIANLFYDPRPPVFIKTNEDRTLPLDFRFYLDYNRNRRFETNGMQPVVIDETGTFLLGDDGKPVFQEMLGEPEWIGVLQNPEYRHSPTNRFIGRYLYLALPISRSLDLNYIHNYSKGNVANLSPGMNGNDGFLRDQGYGSYEINLAAFLQDLNTNMYPDVPDSYFYVADPAGGGNTGAAFDDALSFLRYRYAANQGNLLSVNNLFGNNGRRAFLIDLIDGYAARPPLNPPYVNVADPDRSPVDLTSRPWPGSRNPKQYFEPQEFFNPAKTSPHFVNELTRVSANRNTYDRYTFSRLLEQLGTGSEPEVKGKVNINYVNDPAKNIVDTNFVEWTAHQFFTNVAERLIRQNMVTNVANGVTNFYLFNTNRANLVNDKFSITNIQIYATTNQYYNEYTAPLHRLLQVAANIYDSTTTNYYPTIYRPVFKKSGTDTYIEDFSVETNSVFMSLVNNVQDRTNITNLKGLVWGVPCVVAAKKGFPNFNEFLLQNSVQIARNLQIIKRDTNFPPVFVQTNQMLSLNISNVIGLEAWNSYIQPYTNRVQVIFTNVLTMALTNETGAIIWPADGKPTNFLVAAKRTINNGWPSATLSNSFVLPLYTNFVFLSNSTYSALSGRFVPYTTNYEKGSGFPLPTWGLTVTNRLLFALVDAKESLGRVIDFVNLDNMYASIDINKELMGDTYTSPVREPGELAGIWNTNRVGGSTIASPTEGVRKQISLSRGSPLLSDNSWNSFGSHDTPANKQKAAAAFAKFMGYTPTISGYQNMPMPPYINTQTPFNPTRKLDQTISWQVNDPLVHYMTSDLVDSTNNVKVAMRIPPNGPPLLPNNLGKMNERYRPWGRRFGEMAVGPGLPGNGFQEFREYAYDFRVKDPRVRWSEDWDFPTNKFPNIGWLGRVHRGTPWQTIYLKASAIANRQSPADIRTTKQIGNGVNWEDWSGHMENHPTNDWKLMDLFTVAPNDNAARGLLSINQTNQAAWAAVLSGVVALTNWQADAQIKSSEISRGDTNLFRSVVIEPGLAISNIVHDINAARATRTNQVFESLGDILSVPSLSVNYNEGTGVIEAAPTLNVTNYNLVGTNKLIEASASGTQKNQNQRWYGMSDESYERIPQQILSLLKLGNPQYVVYCYGQSLKPAPNSLVLSAPAGSGLFNLCTNYQITGEVLTRTVLHVEPNPDAQHPKVVIDSYNVLPAE